MVVVAFAAVAVVVANWRMTMWRMVLVRMMPTMSSLMPNPFVVAVARGSEHLYLLLLDSFVVVLQLLAMLS